MPRAIRYSFWLHHCATNLKKAVRPNAAIFQIINPILHTLDRRAYERNGNLYVSKKSTIEKILNQLGERVGFHSSNHDLRRTCGKTMSRAGVRIEQIARIFGHVDTGTAMHYLGLNLDDQDEAMMKLAQFQNSLLFLKKEILGASQQEWWAQRDLDSRPPGYQPGAPTRLSYGPVRRRNSREGFIPFSGTAGRMTEFDIAGSAIDNVMPPALSANHLSSLLHK